MKTITTAILLSLLSFPLTSAAVTYGAYKQYSDGTDYEKTLVRTKIFGMYEGISHFIEMNNNSKNNGTFNCALNTIDKSHIKSNDNAYMQMQKYIENGYDYMVEINRKVSKKPIKTILNSANETDAVQFFIIGMQNANN